MKQGALITLEGCDGSGKSTQAGILYANLKKARIPVTQVREPGSTPLGKHLREYLKGNGPLTPEAELMLFSAARAQMVKEKVIPAMQHGFTVVADRYADSTKAYQGGGRGLKKTDIRMLRKIATLGVEPELTFLLDAPVDVTAGRTSSPQLSLIEQKPNRRRDKAEERRFEKEKEAFHKRVKARYLDMAKREPGRWIVLDGTEEIDRIATRIWERVWDIVSKRR